MMTSALRTRSKKRWTYFSFARTVLLLVLIAFALPSTAQVKYNTWSQQWSAEHASTGRDHDLISIAWQQPKDRSYRTENFLGALTLSVDQHHAFVIRPAEITVQLRVTAKLNREPDRYRKALDRDSSFVISLSVAHGWVGDTTGRSGAISSKQMVDRYEFIGAHAFDLEVISVEVDHGEGAQRVRDLPRNTVLDLHLVHSFREVFDPSDVPGPITRNELDCGPDEPFELQLSWPPVDGATEYQLEWAFVDDIAPVPLNTPIGDADLMVDLRRDATRVSIKQGAQLPSYRIPLLFDRGWLVYRLRALALNEDGDIITGSWTGPGSSFPTSVASFGADTYRTSAHQPLKNWQLSSVFAEEGKHKEVITYADGSLRSRQSVTRASTLDVPIVAETVYDVFGRPAAEIMPVPMILDQGCEQVDGHSFAPIDYYPEFNVVDDNGSMRPLSARDLVPDGDCGVSGPPLYPSNGAALYYGPEQFDPAFTKLIGDFPFLPKSNGYPYAQTEYTPDNTGRVKRKGGVGPLFRLGQDHETSMYYSMADQLPLDRLFGTEAGYNSYYQRTVVVDANGQASATYTDRAGRTVATALVGAPPEEVLPLDSYTNQVEQGYTSAGFCPPLPSNTCASNSYDPALRRWTYSEGFVVAAPALFEFNYTISLPTITFSCPQDFCVACAYELDLILTDECGTVLEQHTDTIGQFDAGVWTVHNTPAQVSNGEQPLPVEISPMLPLPQGSYTFTRILTVHEPARQAYAQAYQEAALAAPECLYMMRSEIESQQLELADPDGCVTCTTCLDQLTALGGLDEYLLAGGNEEDYALLQLQCKKICPLSWCEIAYSSMQQDLSPGGQYAKFTRNGGVVQTSDPASIYRGRGDCVLARRIVHPNGWYGADYNQRTVWQQPRFERPDGTIVPHYIDQYGNRLKVPVIQMDDGTYLPELRPMPELVEENGQTYSYPEFLMDAALFMDSWQEGWARSLLYIHPEFPYYLDCRRFSSVPPGHFFSSDEFDAWFRTVDFDSPAAGVIRNNLTKLFLPPTDDQDRISDPFFADLGTADPSGTGPDQPFYGPQIAAFWDKYINYNGDDTNPLTMPQVLTAGQRCGISEITPVCYAAPLTSPQPELEERLWIAFRSAYLAEKYRFQKRIGDDRARGSACNTASFPTGLNFCIGQEAGDFMDWQPRMMVDDDSSYPPMHQWCQPCAYQSHQYYREKVQRFQDPEQVPGSDEDPIQIAYQQYLVTGVCPATLAWQNWLNEMAILDQITQTHYVELDPSFQAVELARQNMVIQATLPAEAQWSPTVSTDGLHLDVTLSVDATVCNIDLQVPTTALDFDWLQIVRIPLLDPGLDGSFTLTVEYMGGTDDLELLTTELTGTMCSRYLLDPCNFPPVCEPNALGNELASLLSTLVAPDFGLGLLTNTSPMSQLPADVAALVGNDLRHLIEAAEPSIYWGPLPNLRWSFDPVELTFTFVRSDNDGPSLVIDIEAFQLSPPYLDLETALEDATAITNFSPLHGDRFMCWFVNADNERLVSVEGNVVKMPTDDPPVQLSLGTCAPALPYACSETNEDLLTTFLSVVKERLLANRDGSAHLLTTIDLDLFESPLMNGELMAYLEPTYCTLVEEDPPVGGVEGFTMNCQTTGTVQPVGSDGLLITFEEDPCLSIEMPDVPFTDIIDPVPHGEQDAFGKFRAFSATMKNEGETVGQVVVEHDCVDVSTCADCCDDDVTQDLFDLVKWIVEKYSRVEITEGYDVFTSPAMTPALYETLGPLLDPGSSGNYSAELMERLGRLTFGRTGCISLQAPSFTSEYIRVDGAWETIPQSPNSAGFAFIGQAVYLGPVDTPWRLVIDILCGDWELCVPEPYEPPCIVTNDHRLEQELGRILAAKLRENAVLAAGLTGATSTTWLELPFDLFDSEMSDELRDRLGPALCPGCTDEDYSAVSVYEAFENPTLKRLHFGPAGCFWIDLTSQDIDIENFVINWGPPDHATDVAWSPLLVRLVPSPALIEFTFGQEEFRRRGYSMSGSCLDFSVCELWGNEQNPSGSLVMDQIQVCRPEVEFTPCGEDLPSDCEQARLDLEELLDDYRDMLVVQNAPGEWEISIEDALCYFVNGYLCPCVEGYSALIRGVMQDEMITEEEAEDPRLSCIFNFCALPDPCTPYPPVEVPNLHGVPQETECDSILEVIAELNSTILYEEQLVNIAADFHAAYDAGCKNMLETLSRTYTGRNEHHFTLYYYDQAGNLVRTVPPEGVEQATFTTTAHPDAQRIANDRANDARTSFTAHRLSSDYVFNSLEQPVRQKMPDQDAMALWETRVPNGLPADARVTSSHLLPGGVGFLTANRTQAIPVSPYSLTRGMLFKTMDGGNSWTRSINAVGSDLRSVSLVQVAPNSTTDPTALYAVGTEGTVMRSHDLGNSWDLITGINGTHNQNFRDVAIYRQPTTGALLRGIAVGDNAVMQRMTANNIFNGNPAPLAALTGNARHLLSVNVVSTLQRLFITGRSLDEKNGVLFTMSYNGDQIVEPASAATQTMETSATLQCGSMYTANAGYLAGTYGTLVHTTTGATTTGTWRTIHSHTSHHFRDVFFLNELQGVAILASASDAVPKGALYATTDGGVNWTIITDPTTDLTDLNAYMVSTDQARLVVVGKQGKIMRVLLASGLPPVILERPDVPNSPALTASWAVVEGADPLTLRCIVGDANGSLYMTDDLLGETVTWSGAIDHDAASTDAIHRIHGYWADANTLNMALVTRNSSSQMGRAVHGARAWVTDQWVWSWNVSSLSSYTDMAQRTDHDVRFYEQASDQLVGLDLFLVPMTGLSPISNAGGANVPTGVRVLLSPTGSANTAILGGISGLLFHGNLAPNTTWTTRSRSIKPLVPLHLLDGQARAVGEKGTLFERFTESGLPYWRSRPTSIASDITGAAAYSSNTKIVTAGPQGAIHLIDWTSSQYSARFTAPLPVDLKEVVVRPVGTALNATFCGTDNYLFYSPNILAAVPAVTALPHSGGDLHGLVQLTSGEVVAVGDDAAIHKSYGTTRMAVKEVYLSGMNDVHFHDAQHGYAVGDNMVIRYTDNSGLTWQPVPADETIPEYQRNLNAVFTYAPDKAITVGQYGKRKTMVGTTIASLNVPNVGITTALTWNDVVVSPMGAMLIVGEYNGAGRLARKKANSATFETAATTCTSPLRTIWSWKSHPVSGAGMREDYLVGTAVGTTGGNLRLVTRPATLAGDFGLTQITGTQPNPPLLSGAVRTMWFHDRLTGLVATPGHLYRLKYNTDLDHVNPPTVEDLGAGGSPVFPDALDGQSTAAYINLNTIQFTDRNQGFLGGAYTGTPNRYARVVRDEMGLYSQRFWYDKLGRLVLSQNTKQFYRVPKRYSYSRYDPLGRVFESGEVAQGSTPFSTIFGSDVEGEFRNHAIDNDHLAEFLHNGSRYEVTRTHYDEPFYDPGTSAIDDKFLSGEQENLRLRVASTTYEEQYDELAGTTTVDGDPLTYEHATHYSYDIHGNVKELVQESRAMGIDAPETDQAFKHMAYSYDLVSGNVHQVDYQNNAPDQFHHRYTYDADNRITKVETSRADVDDPAEAPGDWREDAAYFYYPHGPLLRTELGDAKVQGVDYAYTLQGWLKAINSNGLEQVQDMGRDSDPTLEENPHAAIARDVFGESLHYYDHSQSGTPVYDYEPISPAYAALPYPERFLAEGPLAETGRDLYNGNISAMVRSLSPVGNWYSDPVVEGTPQVLGWRFKYDQLHRLREANTRKGLNAEHKWTDAGVVDGLHKSTYTYDANGNIVGAKRWDQNGALFDDLTYKYSRTANNGIGGKLKSNRLYHLNDAGSDALVTQADDGTEDLLNNTTAMVDDASIATDENASISTNHYRYDSLGNLTRDQREGLASIDWTASGKVRSVVQQNLVGQRHHLGFGYGVGNHRITKTVSNDLGSELQLLHREHYVHDAQGNVMAIYRYTPPPDLETPMSFAVTQRPIYGSSRLGIDRRQQEAYDPTYEEGDPQEPGKVRYELTDHLGNVNAVITDVAPGVDVDADTDFDEWNVGLISAQEYEPFGSLLPGRNYSSSNYRFGFQGQEKDDEMHGTTGTSYAFEYRIHDPRLGRFLSIDPLSAKYAHNAPYAFSENRLIDMGELEGLETTPKGKYVTDDEVDIGLNNAEIDNTGVASTVPDPSLSIKPSQSIGVDPLFEGFLGPLSGGFINGASYLTTSGASALIGVGGFAWGGLSTWSEPGAYRTYEHLKTSGYMRSYKFNWHDGFYRTDIPDGKVSFQDGMDLIGGELSMLGMVRPTLSVYNSVRSFELSQLTTQEGFLFGSIGFRAPTNLRVSLYASERARQFGSFNYSTMAPNCLGGGSNWFGRRMLQITPEFQPTLGPWMSSTLPKGTYIRFGLVGPQPNMPFGTWLQFWTPGRVPLSMP